MTKRIQNSLKILGILIILVACLSTGCSWLNPGSAEDPGEAVGAPTMPQDIRDAYEEGADYPEEGP